MRRLIFTFLAILLLLAAHAPMLAVDTLPPSGTIPPVVEPWRQITYCPIHALEGFARDGA